MTTIRRNYAAQSNRAARKIESLNAMMVSPSVGYVTQRAPGCGYEVREGAGPVFVPKTLAMAEEIVRAIIRRHVAANTVIVDRTKVGAT